MKTSTAEIAEDAERKTATNKATQENKIIWTLAFAGVTAMNTDFSAVSAVNLLSH
jgi:hypothetical protein